MNLLQQLERVTGGTVDVWYERDMLPNVADIIPGGATMANFRRRLDQTSDVVPISKLLSGEAGPAPVFIVISESRDGLLIQARRWNVRI